MSNEAHEPDVAMELRIQAEMRRFLVACGRTEEGRKHKKAIRDVIEAMVEWSRRRPLDVRFVSGEEKEQDTLRFDTVADGHVLWEAYAGETPGAIPKVVFVTRVSGYLSAAESVAVREKFRQSLQCERQFDEDEVLQLPIRSLNTSRRLHGAMEFFDWAVREAKARRAHEQ